MAVDSLMPGRARRLARIVAPMAAIVMLLEIVVFNLPFWTTLSASTDSASASNTLGEGLERTKDGLLRVTDPTEAYLDVSADGTSGYARIDAASIPRRDADDALTMVNVRLDSDGRTGRATSVTTSVGRSLYLRTDATSVIRLWIQEPKGSLVPITAIRANVKVPFEVSWARVAAICALVLLLAAWRPGSSWWRIRLDPADGRLRALGIGLVITVAALAVGDAALQIGYDYPTVFHDAGGYTYDFGQYDHVAYALLHGHAWLDLPSSDALSSASDPYDPAVRQALLSRGVTPIYWDYAFHSGRWYSYFGVVPAVLLFLPYRAVTGLWVSGGLALPTASAVALLLGGFLVFASLLVLRVLRRAVPRASLASATMALTAMMLGSGLSYLWYQRNFYTVPFVASLMFSCLGLWLWLGAADGCRRRHMLVIEGAPPVSIAHLAAGSLCLAANLGCRPPFVLAALTAFPIFLPQLRALATQARRHALRGRTVATLCAAVLGPAVLVVVPLLVYNMVRFGSPLDFGVSYQLTVTDMTAYQMPLANFVPILGYYLLLRPHVTDAFPWISVAATSFPRWGYSSPVVGGLLTTCPPAVLALVAPFMRRRLGRGGLHPFLVSCALLSLLIMAVDATEGGLAWRYASDFSWLVMIPAVTAMASLLTAVQRSPRPVVVAVRLVALLAMLVALAIAVASLFVIGRENPLITMSPQAYHTVSSWFLAWS